MAVESQFEMARTRLIGIANTVSIRESDAGICQRILDDITFINNALKEAESMRKGNRVEVANGS